MPGASEPIAYEVKNYRLKHVATEAYLDMALADAAGSGGYYSKCADPRFLHPMP